MKNIIKKYFFTNKFVEKILIYLIKINSFFSKSIPSNLHYKNNTIRTVLRNDIKYILNIHDYQEYLIYFDLQQDSSIPFLKYAPIKDGVFIDIGANIGQTSLNLSKKLHGVNHKIYAFEPFPSTFDKLKTNVMLNNNASIEIYNVALGNERKKIKMELSNSSNSGANRVLNINTIKNDTYEVVQERLDDFYKLASPIQFIKIDVEGYEMEVLKGGVETIRKQLPVMVIEVNDNYLRKQNSSSRELISFIISLGYNKIINLNSMREIDVLEVDDCCTDILCKSDE